MRFRLFRGKAKAEPTQAELNEAKIAAQPTAPVEEAPKVEFKMNTTEDGTESISVVVKGKGSELAVKGAHPNYDNIVAAAKAGDPNVLEMFDIARVAGVRFQRITDRVQEAYGKIFIDGEEINNTLSQQIVEFIRNELPFEGLVAFQTKLFDNPNEHAKANLYEFINKEQEAGGLTITDEGNIVGYKSVKSTDDPNVFLSVRSGDGIVDNVVFANAQLPQSKGSVVEMKREDVNFDPNAHCSVGLHVGTFQYADTYSGDTMLEVHVDPRDVVSVPDGAGTWKLRTRKYVVADVLTERINSPLVEAVKSGDTLDTSDIRVGDTFADTDKRRKGATKKVVEILDTTVVVESKTIAGVVRQREIDKARLFSRKYKRVRRGRKN